MYLNSDENRMTLVKRIWFTAAVLWVGLGIFFVTTNKASAAIIVGNQLHDVNYTASLQTNNGALGVAQAENSGWGTTGYVNTFTTSTTNANSVAYLFKNTGGSTCTATSNGAVALVLSCPTSADCTWASSITTNATCDNISIPAGSEAWVSCTFASAVPANRIFGFQNTSLWQNPPTNCSSTYAREKSTDVLTGSTDLNNSGKDAAIIICDTSTCSVPSTPVISNVADDADIYTAVITWDTDVNSSSKVQYGLTTGYGSTVEQGTTGPAYDGTAHTVALSGLAQDTTYHYKVCSTNALGETCSADGTFTTSGSNPTAAPVARFYDPPNGRIFGVEAANAYTFRAFVNVFAEEYPDETIIFDYKIYDAAGPTLVYDNPALPYLVDNTFIPARPGDIAHTYYAVTFDIPYTFEDGVTYTLNVRAKTISGGVYGAWSGDLTIVVEESGTVLSDLGAPSCTFSETGWADFVYWPAEFLECGVKYIGWVVMPPPAAEFWTDIVATKDELFKRWPIYYLFDFYDEILEVAATTCPFPEVGGGTFLGVTMAQFDICDAFTPVPDMVEDTLFETLAIAALWMCVLIYALRAIPRVVPFIHHK